MSIGEMRLDSARTAQVHKMKPKISVLTCTCRDLILKYQAAALEAQTLKDIEWVIVDDIYDQRVDFVKKVDVSFPITHIPPQFIKDYYAGGVAANDGLIHCSGEYIYFMADYVMPMIQTLQRCYDIQTKYGGVMLSGRALKVTFPVTDLIPNYNKKIEGSDYRLYLFEKRFFDTKEVESDILEIFRAGVQNWWAGRNDSAPLKAIIECNGFDEAMDGRWGGEDADLANRLMTYGLRFLFDKSSCVLEFKHKSGEKRVMRSELKQQEFQFSVINKRVKQKIYRANEDWLIALPRDLRKESEEWHKQLV